MKSKELTNRSWTKRVRQKTNGSPKRTPDAEMSAAKRATVRYGVVIAHPLAVERRQMHAWLACKAT